MKEIGTYNKVMFESVEELKDFIKGNYGDAIYYNDWTGDYHSIIVVGDNEGENVYLGSDAFQKVSDEDLSKIYGYYKIR